MGYKQPSNPMKMMKSALKMHKAEKKAGMHRESAMYMGHSPMEMGSPMYRESAELKDMPIVDIEKGDAKGSPAKKYDRVVLGGNKGDKSKTKPGKKDYEGSPAKAAKPDYLDLDKDGNKSEPMKEAAKGSPAKKKDSNSLEDLQNHLTNLEARLENTPPSQEKLKPMLVKQISAAKKKIQASKKK